MAQRTAGTLGLEQTGDAERLREDGARVERLLEELQGMAGPATWQRVEELMQRLVGLYGAGLQRLLTHASEAGVPDEPLRARLCADELVSSLLLLHGLHPVPLAERIQRALDQVRPYLGSHAGGVELAGVDGDGVVRLRLLGSCHGCPSSRATVDHTLRRAIEDAAPEVTRIEVEGVEAARTPRPAPGLTPLRVPSDWGDAQWVPLEGVEQLPPGERRTLEVAGSAVLLLRVAGALLAYRNACTACGARLDGARLEGATLACGACAARYDVTRAGRGLDGGKAHLVPLPLLLTGGVARISVPGGAR